MKSRKLQKSKQSNYSPLSIRKILFYFALFFQINQLLNQMSFNKKTNNNLLSSLEQNFGKEIILPLFLFALMPEKTLATAMMFSLGSLPNIQARSLKRMWKDLTRGSIAGGTFEDTRATLDKAKEVGKAIAQNIGHEARITIQETGKVLDGTIEKLDTSANNFIENASREGAIFVKEFGKEIDSLADNFIINFSNQGKLLIENLGEEVRVTADDTLKKASQHGEFLLSVAGEKVSFFIEKLGNKASLVIHDAGSEMRSVLTHATQQAIELMDAIPPFSETLASAFINELRKQFFGLSDYQYIIINIDNDLRKKKTFNLPKTLSYIERQNTLSPYQRSQLYLRLITAFNVIKEDVRVPTLLYIGAMAMIDEGLVENINLGFVTYQKDYYHDILARMPDISVKAMLEKEDKQQFFTQLGLPMPSPKTTEVGLISFSLTETVPTDYVECDGAEYLVKDKPELYEIIGQTHGYRFDTQTKNDYFRVPDLRDYFLRMASPTNKVGTFQQDTTRMPENQFQTEFSGLHAHNAQSAGDHTHKMTEAGDHGHVIKDAGNHGHSMVEDGEHKHGFWGTIGWSDGQSHVGGKGERLGDKETNPSGKHTHLIHENGQHVHPMESGGSHVHHIENTGDHSHSIDANGLHTHLITGGDQETRPKNVAVKCLIRYRSTDLRIEELEDRVSDTVQTMQNQSQNLQIMSFFAGTATAAAIAAGAALFLRR